MIANFFKFTSSPRARFSTVSTLNVKFRDTSLEGSLKSRKLRKEGFIPGILYGKGEGKELRTSVMVDQRTLLKELREKGTSFENTIYELNVQSESGDMKYKVTPRQTQFNPVTDQPIAVNFLKYEPGQRLRIPIEYINADQSQDLKRGSYVMRISQFVECICDEEVPKSLVVDLANAARGDVYKLRNLTLPPKVRPSKAVPEDLVLAVVKTTRR